ncbi:MAG: UDP-N-acetylmuramoyl-tripeptide--D-alanyl-D-alanine ligase [Spirochaetota bacterium]
MIAPFFYSNFTVSRILGHSPVLAGAVSTFTSITTTSQLCEKGSLFVPLIAKRDGHDFLVDALQRGASAFLCQHDHPILKKIDAKERHKAIFTDNTLFGLGRLAAFHRSRFRPVVIGITGSSGKTTTKELFRACLDSIPAEQLVITEKNYNNEIGTPFTLFHTNSKTRIVVCEMGMNHRGEISRLSHMVQPDLAIITNIGSAHIEFLGSIKEIARAKAEIVDAMPEKSQLFYPFHTRYKNLIRKQAKRRRITVREYSLENNRDISLQEERQDGFLLKCTEETLHWQLPGVRILENLCGVWEICRKLKIPTEDLLQGLTKFRAPESRLQLHQGRYQIIDDSYNANPDSMLSSLEAGKQMAGSQPFYAILGDMKELGGFSKKLHREVGKSQVSSLLSGLFTFGEDSKYLQEAFSTTHKREAYHFSTAERKNLLGQIRKSIPAGSYILLKGSRSMKLETLVPLLQAENP